MTYDEVLINGIRPSKVEADVEIDRETRTIRIRCAAMQSRLADDPKTEINQFNAMASAAISNHELLNGGSKLMVSNGQIFAVTINDETFERCALHPITTFIDDHYRGPNGDSVLRFELNLEYEVKGSGGSVVYTPLYNKDEYTEELEYHFFYDPDTGQTWDWTAGFTPQTKFTEGGIWIFSMDRNVRRVEVYGNGDNPNNFTLIPGFGTKSYIEVNKSGRKYWHEIEADDGITVPGMEKFIWDLHTKLTVTGAREPGGTSIPVVPVMGGVLDGTVLTLVEGSGPDTITVDGDYREKEEAITVEALSDVLSAGAVYGIDRKTVQISTGPKVPSDSGHQYANSNYGCYLAWIRLVME